MIADIFSGLGSIPHWETIYLNSFPKGTLHAKFLRAIEGICQVKDESFRLPSLNDNIVNICFCDAPELKVETLLYTLVVGCTCAFEFEGHCHITKCAEQSTKRCLDSIFDLERNLMVSRVTIQEA
jgi:hypothetical protein